MRMGISGPLGHAQRLAEATLGFGDVELLARGDSDETVPVYQAEWTTALPVVEVRKVLPPAGGVEVEPVDRQERRDVRGGGDHPGRHGIWSRKALSHQLV